MLVAGQSSSRGLMEWLAEGCNRPPGLALGRVGPSERGRVLAVCHLWGGCARVFIWLVQAFLRSGFKGTIWQCTFSFLRCENGSDVTPASQLPLWLASCVPPVSQRSFRLRLSPLCSHSLPICFHLPHFSSLPCSRPRLKVVFSGCAKLPLPHSKIKIKREEGAKGSASQTMFPV